MIRILIYISFFLFAFSGLSQLEVNKEDKYKFVASFDMRNSIVIGHAVRFNGVKLGIGNSKHRFGIGLYGLRKPVITTNNKVDLLDATDTNRYNFGFISLYYEKILYQSKRWEFTAPIHLNYGALKGEYLSMDREYKQYLDKNVTAVTIAVKSHFKIFRWIGLQAGLGYNLILNEDRRTKKALNAPFYSFGVKIFLGETWKLTTSKEYRKSNWEK